jgi:hypothetical protein
LRCRSRITLRAIWATRLDGQRGIAKPLPA